MALLCRTLLTQCAQAKPSKPPVKRGEPFYMLHPHTGQECVLCVVHARPIPPMKAFYVTGRIATSRGFSLAEILRPIRLQCLNYFNTSIAIIRYNCNT